MADGLEDPMERHTTYGCTPCIERHIGPAFDRVLEEHVPIIARDQCYGCGTPNTSETPVRRVSYWYPWPDDADSVGEEWQDARDRDAEDRHERMSGRDDW